MELADLIERYHELKATVKEMEMEYAEATKPYNAAIQAIETECLARLQAQGLQNAKTPHGTAYLATQTRVSVKDKTAFLMSLLTAAFNATSHIQLVPDSDDYFGMTESDSIRCLLESGAFNMLDIRALKEPVKEFVKENNANPPGVEVSHWVECNIRKS